MADRKAYEKKYRDEKKEHYKKYREEHKEKMKEYNKKNYQDNKEEYDKQTIKYNKAHPQQRKKIYTLSNWKRAGIISEDYDTLYDKVMNTKNCEECDVELVEGNTANGRCADHNHKTGLFRNTLCRMCNINRKELPE